MTNHRFPSRETRYYVVEQPTLDDNSEFLPFSTREFKYLSHVQVSPFDDTPADREQAEKLLKERNDFYGKYDRHFVLFSRTFSDFKPETELK